MNPMAQLSMTDEERQDLLAEAAVTQTTESFADQEQNGGSGVDGVSPQLVLATGLTIALCNAVDAVETNAFGFVLVGYIDPHTQKRLDEDQQLSGLLTSGVFIGMLLGGLVAGYLADRLGRRPVLIASMFINAISALFSSLSPQFPGRQVFWLLLFRILAGVGVGGSVPCAFSLMAEWSPVDTRGYHLSLLNASWTAGSIFTALAAWAVLSPTDSSTTWPFFLFVCSLPAFAAIFLSRRYVFEARTKSAGTIVQMTNTRIITRSLVKFAILWFVQSFASYGVGTWIGDVFYQLGFKDPFAASFGFALASVPGAFLASILIERIGRRMLLSLGMGVSGLFAIAFSMVKSDATWSLVCAFGFSIFITLAWVGLGALSSETFPFETRTTSMGIAAAFGRLGSITANAVNPFLLANNLILGVAGVVLVLGGTFGFCVLDDTTGKVIS